MSPEVMYLKATLVLHVNVFNWFTGEVTAESSGEKSQMAELVSSQHVLVCALHELGSLVLRLGTSASPLVAEPATGIPLTSGVLRLKPGINHN